MRRIALAAALFALAGAAPALSQGVNGYEPQPGPVLNVMSAPFVRATIDPIIFDGVTTTPKQFAISKPANATTYRFVNPCDVDVRIRRVSSLSEQVTATTGIRYLARTVEVVGTSNPSFVSIMAVSAPSGPCAPELQYGNGS
ncbi:hypothetical protein [Methylorubrum sp. SB2]|uniref:hypothetical protein n=1 Tax=Methylorubrum subtropicum TaxID=3138812 RepID=UPI00313BA486